MREGKATITLQEQLLEGKQQTHSVRSTGSPVGEGHAHCSFERRQIRNSEV